MLDTFPLPYHPFFWQIPLSSTGANLSYDDEGYHHRVLDLGQPRLSSDSKHTDVKVTLSLCFWLILICQIFNQSKLLHFHYLG